MLMITHVPLASMWVVNWLSCNKTMIMVMMTTHDRACASGLYVGGHLVIKTHNDTMMMIWTMIMMMIQ